MMRKLLVATIVTASAPVQAAPPGMTPAVDPAMPPAPSDATIAQPSYRAQLALADAAVVGVSLLGSLSANNNAVPTLVIGTYLLGSPAIHLAHDHGSRAVASLGLRLGLPLLGAMLGAGAACGGRSSCGTDAAIAVPAIGAVAGVLAASAIDLVYLGREDTIAAPRLSPTVSADGHGSVRLGLTGRF
jgi:hypothetical protein